jgi:multidrug efflux pump subunit AcrB
MAFHLSAWSIKRPVPVLTIALTLLAVGLVSFLGLGIDEDPNIDIPAVVVYAGQQGAGAAELETQVTRKIEDAVAGLGNIDKITSTVQDERTTTRIEFALGVDSDRATNDVRNAIAQIRSDLPADLSEPIVNRLEFTEDTIMTYVITSSQRSVADLSDYVDRSLSRALTQVPGVAQVDRWGGVDREVRVELDPERLLALGITVNQVNDYLRRWNINLPGGRTTLGGKEQQVRSLGSRRTIADLRQLRFPLTSGASIPLEDLGRVQDGFAEPRQAALFNGEPAVTIAVKRSTGTAIVRVEEAVRRAVSQLQLPADIQMQLVFTLADDTRASYRDTIFDTLILGSLFTVVTVGIFLKNWRATWVTALSLPLSIVPTFIILWSLGYTLNSMTLLGLGLAIGNLIDDSVCVIDIIDQHLLMGKSPLQAALDGAREISLAIAATTAVIIAVFLPVAFMGGIPGQFFQPFGFTISAASIFSTLVACTVTPMLAAYLLKPKAPPTPPLSHSPTPPLPHSPYRRLLAWTLRHRLFTVLFMLSIFIGSLQLIPLIPKGLFSNADTNYSLASIELPPGSTLTETQAVMQQVSQTLQAHPAVDSVLITAYGVDSANVFINLRPKSERSLSRPAFETALRQDFNRIPGARVSFRSQGFGGDRDVAIVLTSEAGETVTQAARSLEQQMRQIPGFVDVTSSAALVRPELVIQPNSARAADLNVSGDAIARTAAVALLGDSPTNLARFNLPDRQIPIRVQLATAAQRDLQTLQQLRVESESGQMVPLAAVADIRLSSSPSTLNRVDRQREVTVSANLQGLSLGEGLERIRVLPAFNPLPPGVTEKPEGNAKIMEEIFTRFLTVLSLSVLAIYAILVLLYNHFLYPLVILISIPLSIGGALLALLIAQKELGLFALIGMVLLMALVTKNAILLVDFILMGLEQGMTRSQAILSAGISRFRPIMMTSVSTVAGMIPIALALGDAGDTRSPMAIAVIGGFSTSTLLTLIAVPVFFTYIESLSRWVQSGFTGKSKSQGSN